MPMNLLVAEDAPLSREILRQILLDQPAYKTRFVDDGAAAWEELLRDPSAYDAVILDILMPRLGGLEVLERMRAHPALKTKPVVLCTALGDRLTVGQAARFAVEHYVVKPYSKAVLLEKLGQVRKAHDPAAALEPLASVAARLGLDSPACAALRRGLLVEVAAWLQLVAKGVHGGTLDRLLLLCNGLRGSAAELGVHQLELALRRVEEEIDSTRPLREAFPLLAGAEELTSLVRPVSEALRKTSAAIEASALVEAPASA